MNSQDQNLSYVIAYAVVNDKQDLINFLSENAIIVKEKITDEELTSLVISALASSVKVQENFLTWLEFKARQNRFSNSTGYFSTLPTFSPSVTGTTSGSTTTSTSTSSGFWSGFDAGAVTGILTSGLSLFGGLTQSKEQRKAMEAQANAQIALAQAQQSGNLTQLEIAKLQLQAAQASGSKPKSNTALIVVGVVGGLAVLGTVIYFVTRKK